jgi:hypothetical protein
MRLLVDGVTRLCRVGERRDDVVVLGRAVVVVRAGVVTLERRVDVTGGRELVWRTGRACADDELVERRTGLTAPCEVERVVVAVGVTRRAVDGRSVPTVGLLLPTALRSAASVTWRDAGVVRAGCCGKLRRLDVLTLRLDVPGLRITGLVVRRGAVLIARFVGLVRRSAVFIVLPVEVVRRPAASTVLLLGLVRRAALPTPRLGCEVPLLLASRREPRPAEEAATRRDRPAAFDGVNCGVYLTLRLA